MTPNDNSLTPADITPTDITQAEGQGDALTTLRPTRAEAEAAIDVLIRWLGEDPAREGLRDTPARVVRAWEEFCSGYGEDPATFLSSVFEEVEGYDDMVMLRQIRVESHCEHHMVPIIGVAHIAYLPHRRVVGISKLARVLDTYARRLQTQETLTAQVADCIQSALQPRGVAVMIDAQHQCMTTRGVHKDGVSMITSRFTGNFESDADMRARFLAQVKGASG